MSSFGLAGISQLALGFVEEWKTIWMWVSWILEPLQVLRRFEGDEGEVLTCLDCLGECVLSLCTEDIGLQLRIEHEDPAPCLRPRLALSLPLVGRRRLSSCLSEMTVAL